MIVETIKQGKVKDWRWLLRCEGCNVERWVTQGSAPESKTEHLCTGCRSRKNWKNPKVVEKRKDTCLARYGSTNAFQSPKTQETVKTRYGVENVFQADEVKTQIKSSLLEKFGCEHPMQSEVIRVKMRETMLLRHGVEHALQSDKIKAGIDFHAAWQKRHDRIKAEKGYGSRTSKIERLFYEELVSMFGAENVDQHVVVNGWSIDFYVKCMDTYVQFDGVYWHGLKESTGATRDSKRSISIARTFEKDRRQDEWFKANSLKLIRITDEQFKKKEHVEIFAAHRRN